MDRFLHAEIKEALTRYEDEPVSNLRQVEELLHKDGGREALLVSRLVALMASLEVEASTDTPPGESELIWVGIRAQAIEAKNRIRAMLAEVYGPEAGS